MVAVAPAKVIYVNKYATGANTGLNWTDAYQDLQSALGDAVAGDEIWLVAGDYRPTDGTDRYQTFALPTGVALYGGFAGGEVSREERDWSAYPTFLNGDIGIPGDHRDNSYSVLTITDPDEFTIVDGVEIHNGSANDQEIGTPPYDPARIGGGILISTTATESDYRLTIRNTRFFNNYAEFGGAVYGDGRNRNNIGIAFIDCTFELNQAGTGSGYMTTLGNTGPQGIEFVGCTFFNNSSINQGLLFILTDTEQPGKLTIRNSAFLENESDLIFAKGVASDHTLEVIVENTTFRSNISANSGFNLFRASSPSLNVLLDDLVFRGNEGYNQLIALGEPDTVRIIRSSFVGNDVITLMEGRPRYFRAEDCRISQNTLSGRAIRMEGIEVALLDCVLEDNEALTLVDLNESPAGDTHYPEGSDTEIKNCTIRGNVAHTLLSVVGDTLRAESLLIADTESSGAGAIAFSPAHGQVVNSLFVRPELVPGKEALYSSQARSELDLINCTFYNYIDSETGTVLFREENRDDDATVQIRLLNSILWDQMQEEHSLFLLQNAELSIAYSLLRSENCEDLFRTEPTRYGDPFPTGVNCGEGLILGTPPRFVAPASANFRLEACSPAVNTGNNALLPATLTTDLAGATRKVYESVDLGAYEYQGDIPVLEVETEIVPASAEVGNDGSIAVIAVNGGTPEYTYSWSTGDTAERLDGLAPGTYGLTLTDTNNCSQEFELVVDVASPVIDPVTTWGAVLYPNPVSLEQPGRLQLTDAQITGLRLISLQKQVIWERNWPVGQLQEELPVPEKRGVYLLELTDRDGRRGYLRWIVQ